MISKGYELKWLRPNTVNFPQFSCGNEENHRRWHSRFVPAKITNCQLPKTNLEFGRYTSLLCAYSVAWSLHQPSLCVFCRLAATPAISVRILSLGRYTSHLCAYSDAWPLHQPSLCVFCRLAATPAISVRILSLGRYTNHLCAYSVAWPLH
jgi:hypothetical protein